MSIRLIFRLRRSAEADTKRPPRRAKTPSCRGLFFYVALDLGMNLPPIRVEYAHADGARWPIGVDDKGDRTRDALTGGAPFTNDVRGAVQELDSVLHPQRSTVAQALHEESDSPLRSAM